jgi:sigma-B regulation protein RsbU (phosphoserine phosphatase)
VVERLEKARLDKELRVAADVQHALLPRTAQIRAYAESVGASVACRAIGGDFFEFIDLPSGDAAIVLGDVSGKGPAAALLAAMIQGMIAADAPSGDGPAAIVSRINRRLAARALDARFATLVYAVLSPDGTLVYTNAGHNPPLLLARTEVRRLTCGGPIVGAFPAAAFREDTIRLDDGDTVVMFSDGVTESRDGNGDEFGDERLITTVRQPPAASADVLLKRVLGTVQEFCGGSEQSDDITVTVTRYRRTRLMLEL